MLKKIISFFFLCISTCSLYAASYLQDKFSQARSGDFVVTSQEGHHCVVFIRSLEGNTLFIEEITVPAREIDLKRCDGRNG